MSPRPLSPATVAVLGAVADGVQHGFDVMDATGLPSGTVYPILSRLERAALVRSQWEDPKISRDEGRPARKYYQITPSGKVALAEAGAHYRALGSAAARALRT